MKKLIVFTAVATLGVVVHAQNSFTPFGVIDVGVGHYTNSTASKTMMENGGANSNRLGVRGVANSDNGLFAGFWLEAGLNPSNGTGGTTNTGNQTAGATTAGGLTLNRRATVDIGGSWGAIRLGRDYSVEFWNKAMFDPWGAVGVANSNNLNMIGANSNTGTRISNSVSYLWGFDPNAPSSIGNGKGVYAEAQLALGGNASNVLLPAGSQDGNYQGFRVGYALGPVNVAATYGQTKTLAVSDYSVQSVGGSYALGFGTLMANYNINKTGNTSGTGAANNKSLQLGATIPLGAGSVLVSGIQNTNAAVQVGGNTSNQLALGYQYNLQILKQPTVVYATYARMTNGSGVAATVGNAVATTKGDTSSGVELGLRTSF